MNSNLQQTTSASPTEDYPWGVALRIVVSLALVIYLFIVIFAPATAVSQSDLTRPVADLLRPLHQSLYLGHGYRFFAPNPGPSHIIKYSIVTSDGQKIEGHFPDRDQHWPRLLYHRWFMLSESIFADSQLVPDQALFDRGQREIRMEIAQLKEDGKREMAKRLEMDTDREVSVYKETQKRIERLTNAIGQHLLKIHGDGQQIQLSLHERGIPFPLQVSSGTKLDDPEQLSDAIKTWKITAETASPEEVQGEANQP